MVTLVFFSGFILTLPPVTAVTSVATTLVNVTAACSISSVVNSDHSATILNNTYTPNIGLTTLTATCNDHGGFAIYAIGFSDDEYGNTDMIASVGSNHNIVTGLATSGYTSNWAMKLSAVSGTNTPTILNGFDSYSSVPSNYTKVASFSPDTGSAGASITSTYAVFASPAQPAGSYTGKVLYTLVNPSTASAPKIPTALEQAFAAASKEKYNGYYKMQDMTSSICSSVNVYDNETQTQLIDIRDDKLYWVTKLRDGHCWMTQNLDLDLDHTKTYTHADTDLGWGSDIETTTWSPTRSTAQASGGTFPNWANNYTSPYSADPGDYYYAGYDGVTLLGSTTVNYLTTTNTDYFDTTPYATNGTHGHVGNYYNWTAAIASNDSSGYDTSTLNDISSNPQNSICPAGWRLPTIYGGGFTDDPKNEFYVLNALYNNGSTSTAAGLEYLPLYFVRSGYVNGKNLASSGSYGYYYSSTVGSSNNAYFLSFSASAVYPGSSYIRRDYGRPVRCLAR